VQAAGLFEVGGFLARGLEAVERSGFFVKKTERVVVRATHGETLDDGGGLLGRQAEREVFVTNVGGAVNHRPLVQSMASEERSAEVDALQKTAQPLDKGSAFFWKRTRRDAVRIFDIAGNCQILASGWPGQGEPDARMPATELSGAVGIILEKEILHGMSLV